jgi:anti-sigma regulatory factor (Ser/Thr protein kinase)
MNARPPSKVTIQIANVIGDLSRVCAFVEQFGRDRGVPDGAINDLNLCLDEILSNTISYGYEGRPARIISVRLSLEGAYLKAEIKDDAKPFDPRRSKPPQLSRDLDRRKIGGLGLHFVNALMDVVDYRRSDGYNQTTLKKIVERPAGA